MSKAINSKSLTSPKFTSGASVAASKFTNTAIPFVSAFLGIYWAYKSYNNSEIVGVFGGIASVIENSSQIFLFLNKIALATKVALTISFLISISTTIVGAAWFWGAFKAYNTDKTNKPINKDDENFWVNLGWHTQNCCNLAAALFLTLGGVFQFSGFFFQPLLAISLTCYMISTAFFALHLLLYISLNWNDITENIKNIPNSLQQMCNKEFWVTSNNPITKEESQQIEQKQVIEQETKATQETEIDIDIDIDRYI